MKLLFITDNFVPELNAPATRTYEHCKEWVKSGVDVTVITCVPNFPKGKVFNGYKNKLYQKEIIDGIKVIRVWTFIAANKGFVKRILDYTSFMVSSFLAGLFVKTDVIVATSPQFFTAISGRWLGFWKRKKWIMEVRDLWPESIKAVGAMQGGLVIRFFEYLEKSMYQKANKIVVVTDSFKKILIEKHHIPNNKIEVIKNGINSELFNPLPKNKVLLKRLNLENKIIIGYMGTHGMAHGLDFIMKSAKNIKNNNLHFLFLGDGAKKDELLALKDFLKLENVSMLPSVNKSEVANYISILDIALVNLRKSDTFKSVIPSKIFELSAMHKPILLGVEGEAKQIVESYKIGEAFEPENEKEFVKKIENILQEKNDYKSGHDRLIKDFERSKLALKMLDFISNN
ncbi:glycosyltransferase family 4 protein [Tamlana sp. 2201CG12-4]|uniref:glycosyltransferase family 4 protein n=1 Tax=Tamlana sp. 2201CG12-4 TaxID=3112582 RepID=UPI002DBCD60E|nr:glycosyltransferase family 4 protein [Tamlana sp. 2201CG12-4]MEC3906311.1 glycosyltransferase family 4 protein [Tamlana sp. 2201CG12-4]